MNNLEKTNTFILEKVGKNKYLFTAFGCVSYDFLSFFLREKLKRIPKKIKTIEFKNFNYEDVNENNKLILDLEKNIIINNCNIIKKINEKAFSIQIINSDIDEVVSSGNFFLDSGKVSKIKLEKNINAEINDSNIDIIDVNIEKFPFFNFILPNNVNFNLKVTTLYFIFAFLFFNIEWFSKINIYAILTLLLSFIYIFNKNKYKILSHIKDNYYFLFVIFFFYGVIIFDNVNVYEIFILVYLLFTFLKYYSNAFDILKEKEFLNYSVPIILLSVLIYYMFKTNLILIPLLLITINLIIKDLYFFLDKLKPIILILSFTIIQDIEFLFFTNDFNINHLYIFLFFLTYILLLVIHFKISKVKKLNIYNSNINIFNLYLSNKNKINKSYLNSLLTLSKVCINSKTLYSNGEKIGVNFNVINKFTNSIEDNFIDKKNDFFNIINKSILKNGKYILFDLFCVVLILIISGGFLFKESNMIFLEPILSNNYNSYLYTLELLLPIEIMSHKFYQPNLLIINFLEYAYKISGLLIWIALIALLNPYLRKSEKA